MNRRYILFPILFLICASVSSRALAATLDDDSIHAFFEQIVAVVKARDSEKILHYMDKVMDDKFVLQSNAVIDTTALGAPPQNVSHTLDKLHAIAVALNSVGSSTLDSYDYKVLDIKYSDDHKSAVVKVSLNTKETSNPPTAAAGLPVMHVQEEDECVDTLSLADTEIKLMNSACNAKIIVTK